MNKDIFEAYRRNKVSVALNDGELLLNVMNPESVQGIMNKISGLKDTETISGIVAIFKPIVAENYPSVEQEVIEQLVLCNALSIFEGFQVAYGLTTKDALESRKKQAMDKLLDKKE